MVYHILHHISPIKLKGHASKSAFRKYRFGKGHLHNTSAVASVTLLMLLVRCPSCSWYVYRSWRFFDC